MTNTGTTNTSTASTQPTTRFMWWLGAASGAVSAGATILLIPLAERTADFFAWTIAVPASAAFIGLFYLALTVMGLLGLRQPWWAPARAALVPAVVFVGLVLVTTVLHLDKFHLFSGGLPARVVAWIWLVIYVVTVPVYLLGFWRQRRAPGGDPPRTVPPPRWARLALGGLAVVLILEGLALFVSPSLGGSLWPWALTPLTARMIGVTLVSVALLAAAVVRTGARGAGGLAPTGRRGVAGRRGRPAGRPGDRADRHHRPADRRGHRPRGGGQVQRSGGLGPAVGPGLPRGGARPGRRRLRHAPSLRLGPSRRGPHQVARR